MKNITFFVLFFLGTFFIISLKIKSFYSIVENVENLNCDKNKPKRYFKQNTIRDKNGDPVRTSSTCQKLYESQNDENLQLFQKKLESVRDEVKKVLLNFNNIQKSQKENSDNIQTVVQSLDCKEIDSGGSYDLDCDKPADKKKQKEKPVVDVGKKQSAAIKDASKVKPNRFQF